MIASKRWIALLPTACVLLAAFTGCKTGLKSHSCGCTSGCVASQEPCGNAKCKPCLSGKGLCETSPSCTTQPSGCTTACATTSKSKCLFDCFSRNKTSCGAGCKCQSACGSDCKCKTSCGSTGCVIQPKAGCNTGHGVKIAPQYEEEPHQKPIEKHAAPMGPNPFDMELEDMPESQGKPAPPMPTPMPKPAKAAKEAPMPVPAPPSEDETSLNTENPFLKVSQTAEWEESAVPVAHSPSAKAFPELADTPQVSQDHAADQSNFSQPWSDALGLPSETQTVHRYRRVQ